MSFTIEPVITTVEITATCVPMIEIPKAFVSRVFVRLTRYEGGEQDVAITIQGPNKTAAGKPDKRSAPNLRQVCFQWSEIRIALELMAASSHPEAAAIADQIRKQWPHAIKSEAE